MPKVLISDSMSNVAQKIFEKNNITVDVKTGSVSYTHLTLPTKA